MISKAWSEGACDAYVLKNDAGLEVTVTNYGASVFSVTLPDREGVRRHLTLGLDSIEEFKRNGMYFGATVGRVCSRIRRGRIKVAGREYRLSLNEGENHLHGGTRGFDKRLWTARPLNNGVEFNYTSADGEEGYPGRVDVVVRYYIDEGGALVLEQEGYAHADTLLSMTNHAYFNLNGGGKIYDNILSMDCEFYLGTDRDLLSTGEILCVRGTPLDFTTPKEIGEGITSDFPAVHDHNGYDITYFRVGRGYGEAARLFAPKTGIGLTLYTTLPSIQLYTGNDLDEPGRGGTRYLRHEAVCLEAQKVSDSVEYPHLGSIGLNAGERYFEKTRYEFTVK